VGKRPRGIGRLRPSVVLYNEDIRMVRGGRCGSEGSYGG
jgi:hypothetical protein